MLIEWLYDLAHNIERHGLRWGVAITIYALVRKERRNYYLDKRDEAVFHNQKIIMEHLGVADQWHGPATMSKTDLQSFKRWYLSLRRAIQWVSQFRRRVERVQINRAWLAGVVTYILGQLALKYGFTWNDAWSDTVTDIIITFAIPLIIAFMNRTKEGKDEKRPIDTGSAV